MKEQCKNESLNEKMNKIEYKMKELKQEIINKIKERGANIQISTPSVSINNETNDYTEYNDINKIIEENSNQTSPIYSDHNNKLVIPINEHNKNLTKDIEIQSKSVLQTIKNMGNKTVNNSLAQNEITLMNQFLNELSRALKMEQFRFQLKNNDGIVEKFKIEIYESISEIKKPSNEMAIFDFQSQNGCINLKQMEYFILENNKPNSMANEKGEVPQNSDYKKESTRSEPIDFERLDSRNNGIESKTFSYHSNTKSLKSKQGNNSINLCECVQLNTLDHYFGKKTPKLKISDLKDQSSKDENSNSSQSMTLDFYFNKKSNLSNKDSQSILNNNELNLGTVVSDKIQHKIASESPRVNINEFSNANPEQLACILNDLSIANGFKVDQPSENIESDRSDDLTNIQPSVPKLQEVNRYVIGNDKNQVNKIDEIIKTDTSSDMKNNVVIAFNMKEEDGVLKPDIPLSFYKESKPRTLCEYNIKPEKNSSNKSLYDSNLSTNSQNQAKTENRSLISIFDKSQSTQQFKANHLKSSTRSTIDHTPVMSLSSTEVSDFIESMVKNPTSLKPKKPVDSEEREPIYIVNNHPSNRISNSRNSQSIFNNRVGAKKVPQEESVIIQITIPDSHNFKVVLQKNTEDFTQQSDDGIQDEFKERSNEEQRTPQKGKVKNLVEKYEKNAFEQ